MNTKLASRAAAASHPRAYARVFSGPFSGCRSAKILPSRNPAANPPACAQLSVRIPVNNRPIAKIVTTQEINRERSSRMYVPLRRVVIAIISPTSPKIAPLAPREKCPANALTAKLAAPIVEEGYGSARYLFLYVVMGAASFAVIALAGHFSLGASGAILGLVGLMIAITTRRSGTC